VLENVLLLALALSAGYIGVLGQLVKVGIVGAGAVGAMRWRRSNPETESPMAEAPQIYLTHDDMDRLLQLIESYPGKRFDRLEGELPMNSRVVFENETTGVRREITLVYPGMADIDAGRISILVPVATALLGLRVGQSIDWELPGGEKQRYRIVGVPYQPEAAGEPQ
jgi:regulator of nucleoside diphosphate kinase